MVKEEQGGHAGRDVSLSLSKIKKRTAQYSKRIQVDRLHLGDSSMDTRKTISWKRPPEMADRETRH
jgi:hypothetical protein